jgi:hypothetical protein
LPYLLSSALQEEVRRSLGLDREERLSKAILSCKTLRHLFDLSIPPCAPKFGKRFRRGGMLVTTFAEDAAWPTLLNTSIILIQFDMEVHQNFDGLNYVNRGVATNPSSKCGSRG